MQRLRLRSAAAALAAALALGAPAVWAALRDARALYNTKCALCHGRDGKTHRALAHAKVRDFTDAEWQKSRTDHQVRKSIEEGAQGTLMRAYKGELSAEEIAGLVKLIRAFAPPEPKGEAPSNSKESPPPR